MRERPAPRILVLEDDVFIALDIHDCLIKAGYRVLPATGDAIEALKQAARTPPDIAIVDLNLRGEINGLSAARELAGQYDAQIVFATGFAEEVLRGEHELNYLLIAKPFAEVELLEALERLSGPVPDGLSVKAGA